MLVDFLLKLDCFSIHFSIVVIGRKFVFNMYININGYSFTNNQLRPFTLIYGNLVVLKCC